LEPVDLPQLGYTKVYQGKTPKGKISVLLSGKDELAGVDSVGTVPGL
jgi:hypothetical protein